MEKKWNTVIPADLNRLFLSGTYTGCPRRKGPNFGRVFLRLNYNDITQNTYLRVYPNFNVYGDIGQRKV
jgi:hypothetical protein